MTPESFGATGAGSSSAEEATLPPGTMIGPYRLEGLIGGGGQARVYRARDTQIDKLVAIKILPDNWLKDPIRRARFDREARALAALNEPHIATIHGLAADGRRRGLVLEYVDGETLATEIAQHRHLSGRGALPVPRAATIAHQIALALEAAHKKGIIHRDLKPANIKINDAGIVKVLDFGLAKLSTPEPVESEATTMTATRTEEGVVIGTVAYMSPEQALGRTIDKRTDIWAFGCVLYEMLTGRRPFSGGTSLDTISAILGQEPDWSCLPEATPPIIRRLLSRCLEKDSKYRLGDIGDGRVELGALLSMSPRRFPVSVAIVIALLAIGLATAIIWSFHGSGPEPKSAELGPPQQLTAGPGWEAEPVISPDGSLIAFTSNQSGNPEIWLMDIHGGNLLKLTDHAAADRSPTWSPDGSSLLFVSDRNGHPSIWKTSRLGGAATLLIENGEDPVFSADGQQVAFARRDTDGYYRIHVAASARPEARKLTGSDQGLWDHRHPAWSPDSRRIVYAATRDLWTVAADGNGAHRLTIMDAADRDPVWSPDGAFVYFSSDRDGSRALWRVTVANGATIRLTGGQGPERQPSITRDGTRLVYSTFVDDWNLVLHNLRTGRENSVGGERMEQSPAFAPDGSALAFVSDRWMARYDLWVQPLASGEPIGEPRRLTDQPGSAAQPAYSTDGKWVAYYRVFNGQRDIWIVNTDGQAAMQFTTDPAQDVEPVWSPDDRQLVFVSDREGGNQLWIADVKNGRPAGAARRLTRSHAILGSPTWSRDTSSIAYVGGDGEVWLVDSDGKNLARQLTTGADAARVCFNPSTGALWVAATWGGRASTVEILDSVTGERRRLMPPIVFSDPVFVDFDLSWDGKLVVFPRQQLRGDIWLQGIVHR